MSQIEATRIANYQPPLRGANSPHVLPVCLSSFFWVARNRRSLCMALLALRLQAVRRSRISVEVTNREDFATSNTRLIFGMIAFPEFVANVLFVTVPPEIFRAVIQFVFIGIVTRFHSLWTRPRERQQHETVNKGGNGLTGKTQTHSYISSLVEACGELTEGPSQTRNSRIPTLSLIGPDDARCVREVRWITRNLFHNGTLPKHTTKRNSPPCTKPKGESLWEM